MDTSNNFDDDDPSAVPSFTIILEKEFPNAIHRRLVLWCPTMDLVAVGTMTNSVNLYRINGQRVWTIPKPSGQHANSKLSRFSWRPDGKMLAVGYSDGTTRIFDVNNAKLVHTLKSENKDFSNIVSVDWVDSGVFPSANSNKSAAAAAVSSILEREGGALGIELDGGLEKQRGLDTMFEVDITQLMPKLSVLPASGTSEAVFTSKTSLDALINSTKIGEGDTLDVLLIADRNGKLLLNIYDSFVLGTVDIASLATNSTLKGKIIKQTSTKNLLTHILLYNLVDETANSGRSLAAYPLDLLFLNTYGPYLSKLAYVSTKIKNLMRYLKESISAMQHEFKTMEDLAGKFLRLLREEIEAGSGGTVESEMFQLLITGVPSEQLKEWMGDILMERGQKRWERTASNSYEICRRLIHEHILPTCDRLVILLSRLRGLARWKEKESPLGLEANDFTKLLDIVSGLGAHAHEFLSRLGKEVQLYNSFNSWLRKVVEEACANNDDPPAGEDLVFDTFKIMEFLKGPLEESTLSPFFKTLEDWTWQEGESVFALYSSSAHQDSIETDGLSDDFHKSFSIHGNNNHTPHHHHHHHKRESSTASVKTMRPAMKPEQLPGLMQLANHLFEVTDQVFERPAQSMRRQLRLSEGVLLTRGSWTKYDMRIIEEKGKAHVYIALAYEPKGKDASPASLIMVCMDLEQNGGMSSLFNVSCVRVAIHPTARLSVISVQLVDDKDMIVLASDEDGTMEMRYFGYTSQALPYVDYTEPNSSPSSPDAVSVFEFASKLPVGNPKLLKFMRFDEGGFTPVMVEVNGKEGRRVGFILDQERTKWKVFDLDAVEEEEEEEEEDAAGEDVDMSFDG